MSSISSNNSPKKSEDQTRRNGIIFTGGEVTQSTVDVKVEISPRKASSVSAPKKQDESPLANKVAAMLF